MNTKANFKNIFFTSILLLCLSTFVSGQTIKVISLEDSQPLPGARIDIHLNGQTHHYSTQINGEFKVNETLINKKLSMTISFASYEAKRLENLVISKDTTIALASSIKEFEERSEEHTSELQSRPHLVC